MYIVRVDLYKSEFGLNANSIFRLNFTKILIA